MSNNEEMKLLGLLEDSLPTMKKDEQMLAHKLAKEAKEKAERERVAKEEAENARLWLEKRKREGPIRFNEEDLDEFMYSPQTDYFLQVLKKKRKTKKSGGKKTKKSKSKERKTKKRKSKRRARKTRKH